MIDMHWWSFLIGVVTGLIAMFGIAFIAGLAVQNKINQEDDEHADVRISKG